MRMAGVGMLALAALPLCGRVASADDIITDVNIVTGLDISDSIGPEEMRLEIEGMAQAIRAPEVLAAIRSGPHGRIGFAVFVWHNSQVSVVPWTLIASEDDALAVAAEIEARLAVDVETEARNASGAAYIGRLTDVSRAIDHARMLLHTVPFEAGRAVVNIVGDGADNVGEDAGFARDRVVDAGIVVNGVVLGDDPSLVEYYERQVIGGPGAFLLSTGEAAALVEALTRKFQYEIAAMAPPRAFATVADTPAH